MRHPPINTLAGYRTQERVSISTQVCCEGGTVHTVTQTVVLCRTRLSSLLRDIWAARRNQHPDLPAMNRLLQANWDLDTTEGDCWLCWPEGCEEAVQVIPIPEEEDP